MDLLAVPFESERTRAAGPVVPSALLLGAATLLLAAAGHLLEATDLAPAGLGRAVQGAAAHGGFVALGLVVAFEGRPGWCWPAARLALALLGAFTLAWLAPWGAAAFVLVPILLAREAARLPVLRHVGAVTGARPRALLLGLAIGAFLGAHLLISASLTFGYAVRLGRPGAYLGALAYDVGANALSAEWLFRGALFSQWWRHWGFWVAAALSTVMSLVRYLLDPALPQALEAGAGAVFYLAVLGMSAAALRAWSGSLVPGYLAAMAFFAAYRTLVVG